jgi:putative chitinase
MTLDQLRKVCPYNAGKAEVFFEPLGAAMQEFEITTARRQAAFIAQVAEETGEFRYMREIASGMEYEPDTALGKALGNIQTGDGPRFKGGGGLMLSGRANFTACGKALGIDLIANPSLIEVPIYAMRSAGWFWRLRKLNDFADLDHFGAITHAVNGSYITIDKRIPYWLEARKQLGL